MTDQPSLRQRVARAIHRYDNQHALCGNDIPGGHHLGEADFVLAELRDELAASAAVVPAADRAALKTRIAAAVQPLLMDTLPKPIAAVRADEVADAVLSVLPAPADRASVLTEVADRYQGFIDNADTSADPRYWTGIRDMVLGLRRLAAEAAVPVVGVAADTTPAPHSCGNCDGIDPDTCLTNPHRPADSRPRCPDCGLPHDLTPSMALACASIRAMVDTVAPAAPGPMVPAQPGNDTNTPPVGYSGKGRLWCLTCPRPTDEDLPVTIAVVRDGELCAGCGRDVVDVARTTETPRPE